MNKNKELKRLAREHLTGNYGVAMGGMVLASILPSIVMMPFSGMLSAQSSVLQLIIYFIAIFAIMLLTVVLDGGLNLIHLNIARKRPVSVSQLFHFFKNKPDSFILAELFLFLKLILCMIPFIIAYVILIALDYPIWMLCIFILCYLVSLIAAIITVLRYTLVYYLLADDPHAGIRHTFTESKELMNGNKKQFFVLLLSFIGWYLLAALSFGIAMLWIHPYVNQTFAEFYLNAKREPVVSADASQQSAFDAFV